MKKAAFNGIGVGLGALIYMLIKSGFTINLSLFYLPIISFFLTFVVWLIVDSVFKD